MKSNNLKVGQLYWYPLNGCVSALFEIIEISEGTVKYKQYYEDYRYSVYDDYLEIFLKNHEPYNRLLEVIYPLGKLKIDELYTYTENTGC